MVRRTLTRRVQAIAATGNSRLDRFRPYAAAVIVFGGEEATPARVDTLAIWLANGGRSPA